MQQPLMIEKEKDNDDAKPILKKLMKSIFYNGVTSQQSILSLPERKLGVYVFIAGRIDLTQHFGANC
jgi:hypothetical protein